MADLTSKFRTNLVDDHTADDMNELIAAALRAEFNNTETITATKELTDNDFQFQIITASGASRTVELAPESTNNHVTIIRNAGASNNVVVKDDSGATTFATLAPGEWAMFLPLGGTVWKKVFGGGDATILIEGLKLTWDSTTSVTVGVGACYAENGDYIDVTSALVKSGLSLSASTWYHLYVYLSSGVPAAEVVTTAPVAWKGGAWSKTSDTSRRLMLSFKTDGSGNVIAFQHVGNKILYNAAITASPFRVLSAGTATSNTAVACSGIVPVTTTGVLLYATNLHASVVLRLANSGGTNIIGVRPASGAMVEFFTDASQNVYYSNSAGSGDSYIDVFGYILER